MLASLLGDTLQLGIAQAAVTALLALAAVLVARRQGIHLERETLVGLVRGFVQIVAVGSILVFLFRGPSWTSVFVLFLMMVAAAATAARRARGIQGAFTVS